MLGEWGSAIDIRASGRLCLESGGGTTSTVVSDTTTTLETRTSGVDETRDPPGEKRPENIKII